MHCPHCGAPDVTGATFCPRCRKRVLAPSWSGQAPSEAPPVAVPVRSDSEPPPRLRTAAGAPAAFTRPRAVTLLAVLDLLIAVLLLGFAALAVYASTFNSGDDRAFLAALVVVSVLMGFAFGATALGLLRLRPWARTAQLVLSGVSLLSVPFGTIVGALAMSWFLKPGARILFSGQRPRDLPEEEAEQALEAARETSVLTGAAVSGFVFFSCVGAGILAAVAIPLLLTSRVATNETAAIADVRSVVAAQASYQSANGHYDRLECLAVPSACIPGYPRTEAAFLPGTFVSNLERSGYSFHLEPGASPADLSLSRSSASSADRYAYLAIPVRFPQAGRRIFCGDDTGRVCAITDVGARRVADGRCVPECVDLR